MKKFRVSIIMMVITFGMLVTFTQDVYPASLQTTDRERSLFTGNVGLFDRYGNSNSLFNLDHLRIDNMSNQVKTRGEPRVSTVKFIGEVLLGVVGNVAGGYAGAAVGYSIDKGDDEWFDGFGGAILGYSAGSTFGSALGVYIVGNSGDVRGSFGKALLGSLLGEGAAILVTLLAQDGTVALISFIALPSVGAALLFNSSLRYKSLPESNALLNFKQGKFKIGIPNIRIQPLFGYGEKIKPTLGFKINVLRFAL